MAASSISILEGAYEIVGIKPGPVSVYGIGIVVIDDKLTEAQVKALIAANCPYVRATKK